VIARSPLDTVDASVAAPVLLQLADGYWSAHDFRKLVALLLHMRAAASDAPRAENRAAMSEAIARFLSDDRLRALVSELEHGTISGQLTAHLFDLVPESTLWPLLLEMITRLPEGELRATAIAALRRRVSANPALMTTTLASNDATQIRGALALLDDRMERTFANELVALASHTDESIRIKGLGATSRRGGEHAVELLWRAMESDPSKSVRLYAFRAIASNPNLPGIAPRLHALVTSEPFAERPVWEREKYVRLLGMVDADNAQPLFESWIPQKKWMWHQHDIETLELALRGLAACGEGGLAHVELLAETTGKQAEVAKRVLDAVSRQEIGRNTYMGDLK
ncbi:MAG TPA: hypothetical protein VMU84_15880, partial [Thermoanaerobaculia bacterium]|nr:hypothetical protein [Thermoanaerobaculia bacterium]